MVGEFHTESDTLTSDAYFHYGESADSSVSVAVRYPGKGWSAAGERHVGTERRGMVGKEDPRPDFHAQILTDFAYGRYRGRNACVAGPYEKVRPIEWLGGSTERFYPSPGCDPGDESRTKRFHPGHVMTRNQERAAKWDTAVEVFGAELSAVSGYSRFVEAHWKFGDAYEVHYLCGNDGTVFEASRIFAGLTVPQAECRPGRPC